MSELQAGVLSAADHPRPPAEILYERNTQTHTNTHKNHDSEIVF